MVATALSLNTATAQIKDSLTAVSKQPKMTLDNFYAGELSSFAFDDTLKNSNQATSLRVGASETYNAKPRLRVKSRGLVDVSKDTTYALGQMYAQADIFKNLKLSGWFHTGAPTGSRKSPVWKNWHFETWTEAQIVGWWAGIKLDGERAKASWSVSVMARDAWMEYGLLLGAKKIWPIKDSKVGARYVNNNELGASLSASCGKFSNVAVYKKTINDEIVAQNDEIVAQKLVRAPNESVFLYSDQWYSLDNGKFIRSEIGGGITWKTSKIGKIPLPFPVDLLVWGGYDFIKQKITGYLMVSFELD